MKNKKITCKTGLRKNIIKKKVFEREVILCKNLAKKIKGNAVGAFAKNVVLSLYFINFIIVYF